MKTIKISELEKVRDSKEVSIDLKEKIDIFLLAINDWPTPIGCLGDFQTEVENFIKVNVTKQNIESVLDKIDYSINSWQAESLFQLKDIFEFYTYDTSLNEVIKKLLKNLNAKGSN